MIAVHKITQFVAPGWPLAEYEYGPEFKWGLMWTKVSDEPNEAGMIVVQLWGLGWSKYFHRWILPWKSLKEVI